MNNIIPKKNILIYFGHPAQYLFLRETIKILSRSNNITLVIKTKDVLESLLLADGFRYINILPEERGKSRINILTSLIKRILKLTPIVIKTKSELLIGTDASIAIISFILRKKSITITEDDYSVIKTLANITYPFTNTILCPNVCDVNKWTNKKIGYDGYMKLAYLHPRIFKSDKNILLKNKINNDYVLIRLAKLTAHHDFGIKGINNELLRQIIEIIQSYNLRVYISSESKMEKEFEKYKLIVNSNEIHDILYHSNLLISDSQSMSVEASMLGVPSIRISDFAGKISVLEELEFKYNLTYGIKPIDSEKILAKLIEILELKDFLRIEYQKRRHLMLKDKINVSDFLVWLISNFPNSIAIIKKNPNYQLKFRDNEVS